MPAPAPFIVGAPRSGTTLLRLMLDAHPELSIPPETHFLPLVEGLAGRDQFYETVTRSERWADFQLPAEAFRRRLRAIKRFSLSAGLRCFYDLYAGRFGKKRWGDKTPAYWSHLTLIQALLPEAHFIHMIRDGRDVAVSNRQAWWGQARPLEAYAGLWVEAITEARLQAGSCPHYLEVRYEKLVRDARSALEEICEFLQLPYRQEMECYYMSAQARMNELRDLAGATRSQRRKIHRWTSRPPEESRIGRWRTEMSSTDRAKFERTAGEMLGELGYTG